MSHRTRCLDGANAALHRFRVVVLPGDGIGPEVVAQAVRVLETVAASSQDFQLHLETHLFGGAAIDEVGDPLPESTLQAAKSADAILMGALGASCFFSTLI